MTKLEEKLEELGYWEKIDIAWTTKTTKVYFKDLEDWRGWYIGLIIDIQEQKVLMDFVRNDEPPHVYQKYEFNALFEIHKQYKQDLEVLREYEI